MLRGRTCIEQKRAKRTDKRRRRKKKKSHALARSVDLFSETLQALLSMPGFFAPSSDPESVYLKRPHHTESEPMRNTFAI